MIHFFYGSGFIRVSFLLRILVNTLSFLLFHSRDTFPRTIENFSKNLESKFRFLIESSSLNESPLFAKFHRLEKYPFKNILMPSLLIKNSNFRESLYIEAI